MQVSASQDFELSVLWYEENSSLMFPMCLSCADGLQQGQWAHENEQRRAVGT
jgi:hypothetical protein